MKTRVFIQVCLMLLLGAGIGEAMFAQEKAGIDGAFEIVCAPELNDLTSNLTVDFMKDNPKIKIELSQLNEGEVDALSQKDADLFIVTKQTLALLSEKKLWKMKIGFDVLLPIMNSKNPLLAKMEKQNSSDAIYAQLVENSEQRRWFNNQNAAKKQQLNYYSVNSKMVHSMVADFLETDKNIDYLPAENSENLLSNIASDPFSMGFCRMSELINSEKDLQFTIMPLDLNSDGEISDVENVYFDIETFLAKNRQNEIPTALTEEIYVLAFNKPDSPEKLAFLNYLLNEGQRYVDFKGYNMLSFIDKQNNLKLLGVATTVESANSNSFIPYLLLIVLVLIGLGLWGVNAVGKKILVENEIPKPIVVKEESLNIPSGIYFSKAHTWAYIGSEGLVKVGIDDFLQHITGSIDKIVLKKSGDTIKKGEHAFSIHKDGKRLNIFSPVSGTIKRQNDNLLETPGLLNSSTYDDGWVYTIEPSNWQRETQFLSLGKSFKEWLKGEFVRLKDFLANSVKQSDADYGLVLQDGGEISEGVLTHLGPEMWEDFQTHFVDVYR